jgi:uncharacterized protein YndB with AHSA1/START domain
VTSASGEPPSAERVESEIHVAADPTTVFSYFTDPAKLVRWLGRSARVRPVHDGEFDVEMSKDTWIRGTYDELDAPRRLVLTWRWASANADLPPGTSRVDISFIPREGGTLVRVVHTGLPAPTVPRHRAGWAHYLTRLSLAASGRDPGADTGFTTTATPPGGAS